MFLFLKKTWKIGLSILFGVAVLLFWGSVYPAHISYQEQFQLFLFDADYWWERIVVPGGLADYIAEYLTQFYYHVWAGACILAFLYVLLQRLVWKLAKEQGAADVYYPLSFLPIIVLWHFMGDENAMLSLVVALLLALSASCWYADLKGKWQRVAYILIVLPLLYWTAGAAHFIFMGWVIVREFRLNLKGKNFWGGVGVFWGVGLWGIGKHVGTIPHLPSDGWYRILPFPGSDSLDRDRACRITGCSPLPAVRFARFEEEAGILWSSASGGGNIVRLLLRGGRLRYG